MPITNDILTRAALNLLADIAASNTGTSVLRLCEQLQALLIDAEAGIAEPMFAPEQFAYLPVVSFDGQRIEGIDVAFAALFAVAESRLPLHALSTQSPKVAAWRQSLRQWQRVEIAHAPLSTSTLWTS